MVSLSLSGLLMMSKVPIFLVNLHHGGPHTGLIGAQVEIFSNIFIFKYFQDIRRSVSGVRHGGHLEHHDPLHGASLGGLQSLPGSTRLAEGQLREECRHTTVGPRPRCCSPTLAWL